METLYTILENLFLSYFGNEVINSVGIALNWVCFLIMLLIVFMPIIMIFLVLSLIRKIGGRRGGWDNV